MLRVLPFVSILGGTPHRPNVLVNPTQSRWYRGSFDERAGTKWTESSTLFLQKHIKYTEYFYSSEQLDQTSPLPPSGSLLTRDRRELGECRGGCNKMHWMTGEMRTKEMMVKPEKDWNLMERKVAGAGRSWLLLFNQAFDWRPLVPNRAVFLWNGVSA